MGKKKAPTLKGFLPQAEEFLSFLQADEELLKPTTKAEKNKMAKVSRGRLDRRMK